jgi:hypothetical protein
VSEQTGKKQHTGEDGRAPNQSVTPRKIRGMELARQRERYEQRYHEPAVVEPQLDSENGAYLNLRFHSTCLAQELLDIEEVFTARIEPSLNSSFLLDAIESIRDCVGFHPAIWLASSHGPRCGPG